MESLQLVNSLEELFAVLVVSLLYESIKCITFIQRWFLLLAAHIVLLFLAFVVELILYQHLLILITRSVFLAWHVPILEGLQCIQPIIRRILDDSILTALDLKVVVNVSVNA